MGSSVIAVIITKISIIVFITFGTVDGRQPSKVQFVSNDVDSNDIESHDQSFEDCWSAANFTCIKAMIVNPFKDIWKKDHIKISDSMVIEKIANLSKEEYEMQEETEDGRGMDGDLMMENVGRFLQSHALRVNLWDFGTLRVGRSQENKNNLEIVFDMDNGNDNGEGKSQRMWKIIVPLVMGFKTTGALIFAISAVKLFLLKALLVSKVALLASGFLVLKKVLSMMGGQHHPHMFPHHTMPYYNEHALEGAYSSGYGYAIPAGNHHGGAGYGYAASAAGLGSSGAEDLQAHFSNPVVSSLQAVPSNQTATRKDVEGAQHRVFSLVKSNMNRVPIVTYRKLVDTGRSA